MRVAAALSGVQILLGLVALPFALDETLALWSIGETIEALLQMTGIAPRLDGSDMINAAEGVTVVVSLAGCVVVAWLAVGLLRGSSPARLVVTALGVLSVLGPFLVLGARSEGTVVLAVLGTLTGIAQVVLLQRSDVSGFFDRR